MRAIHAASYALVFLASGCGGGSPPATPATSAVEATATPPAPPPSPPVNPDTAAVDAARPSLRACYDRARAANAALGRTTVTLSLRVDEKGTVSTVNLDYKHKFDDASKACMRDAAFAIKLPPGDPRRVEVPISFEPK